jgi:hypothetical protein
MPGRCTAAFHAGTGELPAVHPIAVRSPRILASRHGTAHEPGQDARADHRNLRGSRLPALPRGFRLRRGLLRGPRRAQDSRPGAARQRARGGRYRPCATGAVRRPAHRDGPPLVQAPLDAHRARARRAVHLRPGREPGAGAAVLAVAPGRGDRLERAGTGRRRALGRVRGGLGARPRLHVRSQPFRPVRPAAGLAARTARQLQPAAVHRARPVPAHPASADGRIRGGLLVGAGDDRRALAVRGRRDRLHRSGHRVRGTRPEPEPGRTLRRLPGPRACADPGSLATAGFRRARPPGRGAWPAARPAPGPGR